MKKDINIAETILERLMMDEHGIINFPEKDTVIKAMFEFLSIVTKGNTKKYNVIYADPPWEVKKIQRKVRPNQVHFDYETMSIDDIKNMPISNITDDNCVCFIWTTQSYLPHTFEILKAWGFKYQRTITWDKMNGLCLFGFHNRTEFLVFGYKGKIEMYPKRNAIPTLFQISSKGGKHSQKPDQIRKAIEVFGENRLELFARSRDGFFPNHEYIGWDVYGNEVEGSVKLETSDSNGI